MLGLSRVPIDTPMGRGEATRRPGQAADAGGLEATHRPGPAADATVANLFGGRTIKTNRKWGEGEGNQGREG